MQTAADRSGAQHAHVDLTSHLDLASARFGGAVLGSSDAFFAAHDNLIAPTTPVFIADKYTDRGKWMDGWESRRRRTPGFDWCVVQLGSVGTVRGVDVDTAHFTGNFPESSSVEGLHAPGQTAELVLASHDWTTVVPKSMLRGDSHNVFYCAERGPWSHLRLKIFPDGGVARLRAYGDVAPAALRAALQRTERLDMAAAAHGARVMACSDMYFGNKDNLIMPGRAAHMGEGWETRRRRGPGHDWIVVRLAARTCLSRVEVSTHHFKGNYPDSCTVDVCDLSESVGAADFLPAQPDLPWTTVLPPQKLQADTEHGFDISKSKEVVATHVRLNIFPDGGVSRLRVFGTLA